MAYSPVSCGQISKSSIKGAIYPVARFVCHLRPGCGIEMHPYTIEAMYRRSGPIPAKPPFEVLENTPHACFVLSDALNFTYCNPAWDRFALENGGRSMTLARNVISRNILDFVPPELKEYYWKLFAEARALGQRIDHDYECSSASVFRLFQMQVFPLAPGHGFVVMNSLRVEHPHTEAAHEPDSALYADRAGLIHMCANCRRTKRVVPQDASIWDWVPNHLALRNVSHSVCPMCIEYYYRPILGVPGQKRRVA